MFDRATSAQRGNRPRPCPCLRVLSVLWMSCPEVVVRERHQTGRALARSKCGGISPRSSAQRRSANRKRGACAARLHHRARPRLPSRARPVHGGGGVAKGSRTRLSSSDHTHVGTIGRRRDADSRFISWHRDDRADVQTSAERRRWLALRGGISGGRIARHCRPVSARRACSSFIAALRIRDTILARDSSPA